LARDNIPVIGWLKLRGRCRACHCWISPRYPLVELTTALVFLGLALVEPLGSGANLPIPRGSAAAHAYPLWGMLFFHFFLFCGLFAAALITYDGEEVPTRMWQVLWLVGLAVPCALPRLRPVGFVYFDASWGPYVAAAVEGLAGSLLGLALGAASWPASSLGGRGRSGHVAGVATGAIVGAFLGWQAAAGVFFLASTAWSTWQLLRYLSRASFHLPWLAFLTFVLLVWLFTWRSIVAVMPEMSGNAPWYVPPVAVIGTLTAAWAGRTLADVGRRKQARSTTEPGP
jgi:leader peptidase (prepilin peptidase)/N-methyltransferase